MASISLKKISKAWGPVVGVDAIDLEIRDKEFMVFLGPSGCGKTTTMRMIAGLEDPTGGEILIDAEKVNDVDARDRDVAMVFQSYALYPNMTIYENIRFPLRMRGVPKEKQDQMVREAANIVELGDYLDRKPRALSGGQRQRAALARAVVRHPRVFLMDEPLSNLDAKLRLTMRAQLKQIQRKLETTTIYVTHDQIEAMTLHRDPTPPPARPAIRNRARPPRRAPPDGASTPPANVFVAGFIGSPPMNLIKGDLENGTFTGASTRVEGLGKGSRKGVILGVRPEDISVAEAGKGHINSKLYSLEPTGDQTLVSALAGEQMVGAKGPRSFRQDLDTPIGLGFDVPRCYLFDAASGNRI